MNEKQKKLFYQIIFFAGIISIVWEIIIYRQTVIDLKILLIISIVVGVFAMFFCLHDFQKLFKYRQKISLYFWTLIQSIVSWGFLTCSLFMFANYYLASNESSVQVFEIINRSSLSGRKYHRDERKPTFSIVYKGNSKELIFGNEYYDNMDSYEKIELTVKKGFFGFDILIDQKLK